MITAQDVRERTFEKSKLGGYDMAEVDEFLEQIADELTATQKETAVLKSKMKVLVDKIEEYRGNENALNQTLLSAQKLATQIEAEARERSAAMVAEAEKKVNDLLGGIQEATAVEEKRLADAKASSAKFFEGIRAMCNAQLKHLDTLELVQQAKAIEDKVEDYFEDAQPQKPVARKVAAEVRFSKEAEDIEEAVRSIEASVAKRQPEPRVKFDLSADIEDAAALFGLDDGKDKTQPFKV